MNQRIAHAARRMALAANIALTLAAAWSCFVFGTRAGGPLMGTAAAANGAVMCSVLIGALAERLLRAGSNDAPRAG
jgi:hypothetical protein